MRFEWIKGRILSALRRTQVEATDPGAELAALFMNSKSKYYSRSLINRIKRYRPSGPGRWSDCRSVNCSV